MATLAVWMNGERVGNWTTGRTGTPVFRYARDWTESPNARAISLSLPITADREIRGPIVDHYFDNLLPDNADIRRRIRDRFQLRSQEAFDLLEAVGRDCVGAVQILPPDEPPTGWNRIEATPLATAFDTRGERRAATYSPRASRTMSSSSKRRASSVREMPCACAQGT